MIAHPVLLAAPLVLALALVAGACTNETIILASIRGLVRRMEEIDTLVLGCTHYPLLTGAIGRVLKRQIFVVDSAHNCARAVEQVLDRQSLCAARLNNGKLHIALTDAADNFLNVAREALQLEIGKVEIRALV